jgi:hypothetical protein
MLLCTTWDYINCFCVHNLEVIGLKYILSHYKFVPNYYEICNLFSSNVMLKINPISYILVKKYISN